jgi:hypothetical protein
MNRQLTRKQIKEQLKLRDALFAKHKRDGKSEAWLKSWMRGWTKFPQQRRKTQ